MTEQLILLTDLYCAQVKRSRARVSSLIFSAGDRIDLIAKGSDLGTRKFERAVKWFSDNWPAGLDWPAGVDRNAGHGDSETVQPREVA